MCSSTRRTRLYACAVLLSICALGANAALQSTNDPFRSIVATVPKPPEEPVCCLHPLPPREPEPEDELLLSFEEWKQRAASAAQSTTETPATSRRDVDVLPLPTPAADDAPPADDRPHFTVPLTDRFNFAATDCSARVHATHKSARGAGGVLSAKRDRYMLSPCADRAQHVVVELCDDVRIDTVQLANFEFFSGVFRDIRISVAKTYTVDPAGWTLLGTYRAKNRRGVQVCSSSLYVCRTRAHYFVVIPPAASVPRLLPLPAHRHPLALRRRVLLPALASPRVRPHAPGRVEVGGLGR
jgi:hypothetical protein